MTARISIIGPNLRGATETFHVHAEGCRDIARYGPYTTRGGELPPMTINLEGDDVAYEASRFVYADHISDYGYEYDSPEAVTYWNDVAHDFRIFPCVGKAAA